MFASLGSWTGGRILRAVCASLAVALASGCATTANDPRDPFEGFNRAMSSFNDGFDDAIGRPLATAYRDVVPAPVRGWVRNFFSNIGDLFIGVNNMLQGKFLDGWTDWVRFAVNSTFGVFGINDVASDMGLEKHNEDFGQTLGRWGAGTGPYLVWPFFGSSNVRDTAGLVLDLAVDPVRRHEPEGVRTVLLVTRALGVRADLLDASRLLEEAALDKYVFQRDAYLQRRRGLVFDGNPPRERSDLPAPAVNAAAGEGVGTAVPPEAGRPVLAARNETR